jgi:hypothetical protein
MILGGKTCFLSPCIGEPTTHKAFYDCLSFRVEKHDTIQEQTFLLGPHKKLNFALSFEITCEQLKNLSLR